MLYEMHLKSGIECNCNTEFTVVIEKNPKDGFLNKKFIALTVKNEIYSESFYLDKEEAMMLAHMLKEGVRLT